MDTVALYNVVSVRDRSGGLKGYKIPTFKYGIEYIISNLMIDGHGWRLNEEGKYVI